MSLFFELCRLCLNNCGPLGVTVCPEDFRHQKIRDCLSIIIADERFRICGDCDGKLACFYQFRVDSVRAQHEFADIMRSMQPPQPPHYDDAIYAGAVDYDDEAAAAAAHAVQTSAHDYHPYLDHELHLALDDNHSLISMPNAVISTNHQDNSVYQQQIHTPLTPQLELRGEFGGDVSATVTATVVAAAVDEVIAEVKEEQLHEQATVCEIKPNNDEDDNDKDENIDDFPYEDFDESRDSFPSDRNNVDNAIDRKIEEFIRNKRSSKTNPKICTVCNKLFRTNYKLREHMQTHAENNARFVCEHAGCGRAFKSKIGLREHAARHTGEFNFACDVCQKRFLLRSYFLAHRKIHSDAKTFACSMCSKAFKTRQHLVNHENFHYGLKLFACETCGKSFTTKNNLEVHARGHDQKPQRQFECNVCGKLFKTSAYLKVHTKTHYKALQNYACHCGKTFIQLCDLKTHAKTHLNQKDFVCEVCGDAFTRKDSLNLHISSAHTKDKMFACGTCQKTFTRKASLNKHMRSCLTDLSTSSV